MVNEETLDKALDEEATAEQPIKEKTTKKKKKTNGKRRQARPFAKLPQPTLDSRMQKLAVRMQKSKTIHDKAEVYYLKYKREADLRLKSDESDKM